MDHNSFGHIFKMTTFGESHGKSLGVVIDGCPSGVSFDVELLQGELNRRKPGSNNAVSARSETDEVQVLSGVYQGKTLGTPITMMVTNQDARPQDYEKIATEPRLGHADQVWKEKFSHVDGRGGGRSSGRETVSRVMAGAVAKMFLKTQLPSFDINTKLVHLGPHTFNLPLSPLPENIVQILESAKLSGESFGASVEFTLHGVLPGLGQPVFHKLKSELASAILSIGSVNGIEFGLGFQAAQMKGSDFHVRSESVKNYGGIQGGISNGDPILLHVSFKPTSSIMDVAKSGRHDPCIAIRAAVVVESMAALVIADQILLKRLDNV